MKGSPGASLSALGQGPVFGIVKHACVSCGSAEVPGRFCQVLLLSGLRPRAILCCNLSGLLCGIASLVRASRSHADYRSTGAPAWLIVRALAKS